MSFLLGKGSKKLWWHQVVLLGVMLGLSLWRLLWGRWSFGLGIFWWWLGGVIGFLFVFSDRLVHSLVTNEEGVLDAKVKEMFRTRKIAEGLKVLLLDRDRQANLMMRSALFMVIWLILAYWTMVGVTVWFARGFMLGMGVHFVFDLLWDYFDKERGVGQWFWQIKRRVTAEETKVFVWVMVVLSVLVIMGL